MSKLKILLLFSCFSNIFSNYTLSQELDSAYLENLVKKHLEQQLTTPEQGELNIEVRKLDPRISISPCSQPLTVSSPKKFNPRNINVQISCNTKKAWRLFVTAKVTTVIPVVVAKQYIAKGSQLSIDNITIDKQVAAKIRGEFYSQTKNVIGVKATKSISKGKIINRMNICLVCKGEQVIINASATNFNIQTSGIALSNGIQGQTISVKNSRSGRVIQAKIKTAKQVEINL